jgi:hypothetical protein
MQQPRITGSDKSDQTRGYGDCSAKDAEPISSNKGRISVDRSGPNGEVGEAIA